MQDLEAVDVPSAVLEDDPGAAVAVEDLLPVAGPVEEFPSADGRTPEWLNAGMDVAPLLLELYGRIPPLAREAVEGLDGKRLAEPPAKGANPIAWLVWHLTRVQDHHVSELIGRDQLWVSDGWAARFGLDADPANTGYGHSPADVAAVRPEGPDVLLGYLDAADGRTGAFLETLAPADLDRIIDRRWDPPVTLGVRLVSIADDCLQHAGQAAYVRGLLGD